MIEFTVKLSEAEVKAMEIIVPSVQEWIEDAVRAKAAKCIERAIVEHDLSEKRLNKLTKEEKEQLILSATVKSRVLRDLDDLTAQVEEILK